jgi:serine/threonine protein kinase
LAPIQIVRMAERLISALAHIHDRNLIHCDVSPDNICVSPNGEPVLIDFGAARELVDGVAQKHGGFSLVKDGYSPPELYQSHGVCGPETDIYALAASLYYAITGKVPVDGETRLRALTADRPDPIITLAGVIPGYPPGFLATIDKAMSVEPSERFATAKSWLRATAARPIAQVQPLRPPLYPVQDTATQDRNVVVLRRAAVAEEQEPKAVYSGV